MFPNRPFITKPAAIVKRSALCGMAALSLSGIAASVPVAEAQAATTTCPATTLVQPFLKYGDENYYSMVSGGSFEGASSWSFSGGAKIAAGGEASTVGGSQGADSLLLPALANAQSPFTCIEPTERSFRVFARSEGASATVLASVVYQTILGNVTIPVKTFSVTKSWEPSPKMQTGAVILTAISGGVAHMALHFTTVTGSARIDDVYLDPRRR